MLPAAADLRIETHSQVVSRELAAPVLAASLLSLLSGLSLLLALLGVYSMLTFAAAQRKREVGIRMALGAGSLRILTLFLRQGVGLVSLGALVGCAGAWGIKQLMEGLLFGMAVSRPHELLLGVVLVLSASLVACFVPALRASRTDPAGVMKEA